METQIVKYDISEVAIRKMKDLYMDLTITDIANKDEFDAVHDARMIVKDRRIHVEKKRAELKADSLKWGRKVDAEAKRIKGLLEPIETHLSTQEKKVTDEQKRIKAEQEALEKELINKRVSALFAVNINMPFFDVAMLDTAEYEKVLSNATEKYQVEQKRIADEETARKVESERLEAEADRLKKVQEAQVAERKEKLDAQAAEIEETRLKQEESTKLIAAKEKALKEQEQAIEDAKQREQDILDKIAFETKATKKARFESLQLVGFTYSFDDLGTMPEPQYVEMYEVHRKNWDTQQNTIFLKKMEEERLEEEKRKKKEAERVEALKPDKQKLVDYGSAILAVPLPEIATEEGQKVLGYAIRIIGIEANEIIKQAKEL